MAACEIETYWQRRYHNGCCRITSISVRNVNRSSHRQGARLGILTQGASAFALRRGAGGRLAAVPFQTPPQEVLRDRGVLQRLSASHTIGQHQTIQRRQSRERNRQRPNELRRPGGPQEQQNVRGQPGGRPTGEPHAPGPQRAPPRKPNPSGQKRR
jgi:hypothetical protein